MQESFEFSEYSAVRRHVTFELDGFSSKPTSADGFPRPGPADAPTIICVSVRGCSCAVRHIGTRARTSPTKRSLCTRVRPTLGDAMVTLERDNLAHTCCPIKGLAPLDYGVAIVHAGTVVS